MASESQPKDNSRLSVNRMRLPDRIKSIGNGIKLFFYKEYTEDKGSEVDITEAVSDGAVVGRFVQKDGKALETSASPDAQASGDYSKMARAAGVKEKDITMTAPTEVSKHLDGREGMSTDMGVGPAKVGSIGDNQAETPGDPEQTESADLAPDSEPKSKTKKGQPKEGKPDNSLFKQSKSKASDGEGDFKAESVKAPKSSEPSKAGAPKEGKPDKSMSQMASMNTSKEGLAKAYDIKAEPGKITYSRKSPNTETQTTDQTPKTPETPIWKQRWDAKPDSEKRAFRQHLARQRPMNKASSPKMTKADDDKQISELRARMNQPKQMKPGSRDEKIAAALARQGEAGSPYAEKRDSAVHVGKGKTLPPPMGWQGASADATFDEQVASLKALTDAVKNVLGKAPEKRRTKSDDLFALDRKLKGGKEGADAPTEQPKPKPSHLKVVKSISEDMRRLRKNVLAGYGPSQQTGVPVDDAMAMSKTKTPWIPTPHTSRPEIMNKSPKTLANSLMFLDRARSWFDTGASCGPEGLRKGDFKNVAALIHDAHMKSGGSTYNLKDGHVGGDLYAVSPYLQNSQIVKGNLTPEDINSFIHKNKDLLSQPGHNLGTWHDAESGKHYLDVTVTTPDRKQAEDLARKHNQKAIFHLGTQETIPTGGTGER